MPKHLVVIGGGAAGFFCAVNAAKLNPQLSVTIIEKTHKLLSKVKVSGGGRCNVTHACFNITEMSRQYPRGNNFVKKTFHQFFTTDTIEWFEERGVKLKAEADGRMFPVTDSSQTIINCLLKEADRYGVKIIMGSEVRRLNQTTAGNEREKFNIELADSRHLISDFVCIACGGYPKSSMFDWLKEPGHSIEEPFPSLFTFNLPAGQAGIPGHPITKLMGVSVEKVKIKIINSKLSSDGPLLITHWGFSGPAVLRLSAWGARELAMCNWQFTIHINWLPEYNEQSLQEKFRQLRSDMAAAKILNRNLFGLPQRLWEFLLEQSGVEKDTRWSDLQSKEQNKIIKNLCACEFTIKGKTTYKEEFVTSGGIKLSEVDANTMMSKKVPRLYFAGEILDVDGITGGFNFQHAWTSGFIAAKNISVLSLEAM